MQCESIDLQQYRISESIINVENNCNTFCMYDLKAYKTSTFDKLKTSTKLHKNKYYVLFEIT